MNTNNVMTPSFGAALSVMRRSFNLKAPLQFPSMSQNNSPPKNENEPEILTTNSLNDLSQDPSFRLALELRKNSHYHFGQGNSSIKEESPITFKLEELSPESRKFSETRVKKKVFQPEGDANSDVSPDEVYDGSNKTNTTTPINISLIRLESIFEKDKAMIPITPQVRNALDFTKESSPKKANRKSEPVSSSEKTGSSKLNVLSRGLLHLRKSLTRKKTVKKEMDYQVDTESAGNMTMQRSEIQRSQAHYSTWSQPNNVSKLGDETKRIDKEQEEEKMSSATQSIKIIPDEAASPQKCSRTGNKPPMSASKLDESPIHMRPVIPIIEDIQLKSQIDLSAGNSPFSPSRSPNERRRASGGLNLQQVQQDTVKEAFKIKRRFTAFAKILSLPLFMMIVYIGLALIDSMIAYPFERKVLHLWVGQFLHGIALGILSYGILKIIIRKARKTNRKIEEKALGPVDKTKEKVNDIDIKLFGCFLIGVSGFATVLFVNSVKERWFNAFTFVGLEIAVLTWNAFLIWIFFAYKNHHDSKAIEEKQKKGFFFVPIYKFFMSDLKNTKKELANNPDGLSPTSKIKNDRKEEGIDKFKPKRSFEIVTLIKVLGSQVLLLVLYAEFLAVVGFIKLYNILQQRDQVYAGIPIVLIFPMLVYLFYKILKLVDLKAGLGIMLHTSYINTAFGAMFYRAVALNIRNLDFVWLIIACKISYKLGLYVIYGCRIQFWRDLVIKIKEKLNKKNEIAELTGSVLKPFSQVSIVELSRIDTLTSKQMKAFELEEDTKKETLQTQTKRFVMRFILIQTSDILFNIASLIVFICYRWNDINYASRLLDREATDLFIVATWIELVTEVGISLVVCICWIFSKAYNYLNLNSTFNNFFRNLAVDFVAISFPLLLSYFFMLRL